MALIPVVAGNANAQVPQVLKVQVIDLATLDPTGFPVGITVVDTAANSWGLQVSTATIDHTNVETVLGCPSLRWVLGGGGGGGGSSNATTPVSGTAITNADVTINPGTDKASRYTLPATTYTGNHVITLGTTGSPPAGTVVEIVRRDATAFSMTIANGGLAGGNLVVSGATPTSVIAYYFQFDGVNWLYINQIYAV